jgi:hypothetical protein
MERTIVKYKKYATQGSGHVNVPKAIAGALNWKPEDDIVMEFDVKDGNQGIFLHKITIEKNKE